MRPEICLFLALFLAPFSAQAAPKPANASDVIADRDRAQPGPRAVLLVLAQDGIETSFDVGRVAPDQASGLLDALIVGSMDKKKKILSANLHEKAEATVRPLRAAIASFDIDTLALTTTQAALGKPGWVQPLPFAVTKDASPAARSAFVANAETPQLALIAYHYDLSPDFTQIRVTADIALARKPVGRHGKPQTVAVDFYRQHLTSIVQLRKRSYDHAQNVAQWSAEDGKLARTALVDAFAGMESLIPFALDLNTADRASVTGKQREKIFAAGLYGPLVERAADNSDTVTIWTNGLVRVRQTQ